MARQLVQTIRSSATSLAYWQAFIPSSPIHTTCLMHANSLPSSVRMARNFSYSTVVWNTVRITLSSIFNFVRWLYSAWFTSYGVFSPLSFVPSLSIRSCRYLMSLSYDPSFSYGFPVCAFYLSALYDTSVRLPLISYDPIVRMHLQVRLCGLYDLTVWPLGYQALYNLTVRPLSYQALYDCSVRFTCYVVWFTCHAVRLASSGPGCYNPYAVQIFPWCTFF